MGSMTASISETKDAGPVEHYGIEAGVQERPSAVA